MAFFHGTGADLPDGSPLLGGAVGGDIDPECVLMKVWATQTHGDAIKWAKRVWRTSPANVETCAYIYEVELSDDVEPDPNYESDTSVMASHGNVLRRVATYSSQAEADAAEVLLVSQESRTTQGLEGMDS